MTPRREAARGTTEARPRRPRAVVLVGFMGSGKSAVGRALAPMVGAAFVDLDAWIVRRSGCSVPAIFRAEGERGFRKREADALREVLKERGRIVIAAGGGLLTGRSSARLLRSRALCVWLDASFRACYARAACSGRPLLPRLPESARVLYRARRSLYTTAEIHVRSDRGSPAAVACRVADRLVAIGFTAV